MWRCLWWFRLEDFEVDCEVDCEEDWEIVVCETIVCEAGVWLWAAVTVDLNLVGRFTTSRFASVCCRLEGVLVLGPSTRGGVRLVLGPSLVSTVCYIRGGVRLVLGPSLVSTVCCIRGGVRLSSWDEEVRRASCLASACWRFWRFWGGVQPVFLRDIVIKDLF